MCDQGNGAGGLPGCHGSSMALETLQRSTPGRGIALATPLSSKEGICVVHPSCWLACLIGVLNSYAAEQMNVHLKQHRPSDLMCGFDHGYFKHPITGDAIHLVKVCPRFWCLGHDEGWQALVWSPCRTFHLSTRAALPWRRLATH